MAVSGLAKRAADWDPSKHPRGWHGQWAHTGGDLAAKAQTYIGKLTGHIKLRELNDYDVGDYKRTRLDPAFHYTPEQERAIRLYTGASYKDVNGSARMGLHGGPEADAISSAMQPLPDDLILLREIRGMDVLEGIQPGDVLADDGFSSTTLIPGRFAGGASNTTVLHILAPQGTPAVWANPASEYPEDEIILDRGQPMAVMSIRPRPGRADVTDVNLLVLPKEAAA